MQQSLSERYEGKRVLLTGTTGFLGKVLLEKFLYSLPQVDKIYVLIRSKKGSDLSERFKKEIVSSACFDRLRNVHQHLFEKFIETKVQPIQGDLLKDNLNLTKADYEDLVDNCQIIINCAASIDFNSPLNEAIDSNIRGSLRMMTLASKLKKLQIFTHISTCYVNCDMRGLIKEEIYEKPTDPETQFKNLQSMSIAQLLANSDKLLGEYPNTYTYTKSLCERLMKARKKDLPVCIVRPAIINTSYQEPSPGWLDSLAAAAVLYLFVGLGIVQSINANPKRIGDTVPVDMVVANAIVATAFNFRNPKLTVYHVGSSDRNPTTWSQNSQMICQYWNSNKSQSQISRAQCFVTQNKMALLMSKWQRKLPVWLYTKVSPLLGKQQMKNAQRMGKSMARGEEITRLFSFFIQNQWIYQCRNVKHLLQFLTEKEKKQYLIDAADIDMKYFVKLNNYGLQKYILKQNIELPSPQNSNLLKIREETSYFSDIKWVMQTNMIFNNKKNVGEIKTKMLSSTRVLAAIDQETTRRSKTQNVKFEDMKKLVKQEAVKIVTEIVGEIKMPVVRFLAWTLHKIFKNIYEKVNINMEMFATLRQIEENMKIPIVLLPTHRSYIDFLIVSYIFFVYKLKLPYIVSDEALMKANLLPFLIKSSGAFFYRKKQYKDSRLYRIIFDKYIELLLRDGNNLEFFIEGTRSRTGKILTPQFEILNILLQTVMNGKLADVCLVPLTINYEKVLEGDTFPTELLGQEKVQESLLRVVKAVPLLKVNYGRVYVEICQPLFLKTFLENMKKSKLPDVEKPNNFKKLVIQKLGKQIVQKMTQKIVIMSTGIVSSVLLMHRKGISEDLLIKTVNWISKYILKKGYKIGGINENSSTIAVRNAISHLSEITVKTKKNIFELQIIAGNQFHKILMLSYYRNTIMHVFLPEAFIGCVVHSFGNQLNEKEGVKLSRVHEESIFIMNLMKEEYSLEYDIQNPTFFKSLIQKMEQFQILQKVGEDKIIIHKAADKMIGFYFSLLRSLIECYWASLVYIITIKRSDGERHEAASYEKFFDTIQWFMESLYEEKVIEHYEACSLQLIKNAFQAYEKQKLIKIIKGDKKKETVVEIAASIETLEQIENNLKFFIKSMHHNSVLSPMDVAKSSLKDVSLSKL